MKLSLYYPVKPLHINQGFGGNGQYYKDHGINIIGHNGIDFQASHGQPVYAAHDGTCYPEIDNTGGNGVVLITDTTFEYEGKEVYFKSIYWHLIQDDAVVKTNQKVKAGDLIGYADSTGLSTGDHLHFGLKPVVIGEPNFTWYNVAQTNGYLGAIDPTSYFNGLFAEDIKNPPTQFKHTFYIPLKLGNSGTEVMALQKCLQGHPRHYFPVDQECTGFYGEKTATAVFEFQRENVIRDVFSFISVWTFIGSRVGSYTIPVLNKLFS